MLHRPLALKIVSWLQDLALSIMRMQDRMWIERDRGFRRK